MIIPKEEVQKYYGESTEGLERIDFSKFPKWVNDIINSYSELWADPKDLNQFLSWAGITEEQYHNLDFTEFSELISKYNIYRKNETAILTNSYYPIYCNEMTNDIIQLNSKKIKTDNLSDTGTSMQKSGEITVVDYSTVSKNIGGSSTIKVLDLATQKLSQNYFYGTSGEPNTIILSVEEYAHITGKEIKTERQKERLIEQLRLDLNILMLIRWKASNGLRINSNFKEINIWIVEGYSYRAGNFHIYYGSKAAEFLSKSYVMLNFPTNLYKLPNKHPNSYFIGRKIIAHNHILNNIKKGSENSLSVKKLIECSELPTFEELKENGQRNWKRLIKDKLELALNDNVAVKVLKKWEYRYNDKTIPPEQAAELSADEYQDLIVDYTVNYSKEAEEKRMEWIKKKESEKIESESDKCKKNTGKK